MPYHFPDTVEKIESVPENFRAFYADVGGVMTLRKEDPTILLAATTIAGQHKALQASRSDVKKLQGERVDLSALSDYGTTVEEIKEGIGKKLDELAKAGKGSSQAELDKLRASLTTGFETERKKLTEQAEKSRSLLYEQMVVSDASQALAEHRGEPALLLPVIRASCKVVEIEGKPVVNVIGSDGEARYSNTDPGKHMGVAELVAELKTSPTYGRAFLSENQNGGSGATKNPGVKSAGGVPANMTPNQKIAAGLKKGLTT